MVSLWRLEKPLIESADIPENLPDCMVTNLVLCKGSVCLEWDKGRSIMICRSGRMVGSTLKQLQ